MISAELTGGPSFTKSPEDLVEAQYAGPKAELRPIYEKLLQAARKVQGTSERITHRIALESPKDVDAGVLRWLKRAYTENA